MHFLCFMFLSSVGLGQQAGSYLFTYLFTPCSKTREGVLSSWYYFANISGCVILSYNERKTVIDFISWTQWFCFSSLLRHSVKFVKWRLPSISHSVCCSLQLLQFLNSADTGTQEFLHGNATYTGNLRRFVMQGNATQGNAKKHNIVI